MAGASKRGRPPTVGELRALRQLRAAVAADAQAGRLAILSRTREAQREAAAARRAAIRRLLEPEPGPQADLAADWMG